MITCALLILSTMTAGDPVDLKILWKKDQKITYLVGVKSDRGKAEGRWVLTVVAADEKILTVSWPQVDYSGGQRPKPAGSYSVSRKGRLIGDENSPEPIMYLAQMLLPDKPVSVGETIKLEFMAGNKPVALQGKLEKLDGDLAYFAYEGTMRAPDGSSVPIAERLVFDMKRGYFKSSELDIKQSGLTFYFTLPESQP